MSQEQTSTPTVCSQCGADKLAHSHSRSRDKLVMQFLPKRPYRCLHCYHRFWQTEPFFASASRVMSWLGVIVLVVGIALLPRLTAIKQDKPQPFSDFGSKPNAVPGKPPAELLESSEGRQAVLVDNNANTESDVDSVNKDDQSPPSEPFSESPSGAVTENLPSISADAATSPLAEQQVNTDVANPAIALEELYTTEQLQQRLELAKATAEEAERQNLNQQARLQQSVANDPGELRSLFKVDINFRIDQWRKAWEFGFVDDYLSFYSEQFLPGNELTRTQWVAQRKQRIRPSKKVDLELNNFDVVFSDDNTTSTVSFDQVYRSGSYVEASRKELVLQKEQQEWKIITETEIPTQVLNEPTNDVVE